MNIIDAVKMLINDGVVEKKEYHVFLREMERQVNSLLETSGFDYSKTDRGSLFRLSENARLSIMNAKEAAFEKNEKVAICEGVSYWYKIFDDFLDVYHLGFCHDFALKSRGWFEIEISCLIHTSFSDDNKESAKLNFLKQIKTLKDMGFDLDVKKSEAKLMNTGNNHNLIQKLLRDRDAKMVSIKTMGDEIRSISFSVHPEKLENFCVDKEVIALEVSDNLNADEVLKLKKLCSDMSMAIGNMQGELLHTCGSLVESYFSDMCKTLNFECELRTKHEKRFEETRKKNMSIRDKELALGEKISLSKIHEGMKEIEETLEAYFTNKISFRTSDLEVHKYGGISLSLVYISSSYSFSKGKLLPESKIKEMFSTVGTSKRHEDLFIEDTPENRKTLFREISSIPSVDIRKIESEKRDGFFVIKKIDIFIDNVADIFELKFEENNEDEEE